MHCVPLHLTVATAQNIATEYDDHYTDYTGLSTTTAAAVATTTTTTMPDSNTSNKATCKTTTCSNPRTAKKIYILGPSGVGKSSFINVMTGHNDDSDCFKVGNKISADGGVTKNVFDKGCFNVLKGTGKWRF